MSVSRVSHATEPDGEARTLCGLWRHLVSQKHKDPVLDNANPTCKRCLRVIARRLR